MSKDLREKLSTIFEMACDAMIDNLNGGEVTAADLNAIRGFLKDNGITALPVEGSPLGKVADALGAATGERYAFPFAPSGAILDKDDPAVKQAGEQ